MNDRILYSSRSLDGASSELDALMEALSDVAGGLQRVNTSEEWWGKVNVRLSEGTRDARSAVRSLRADVERARDRLSDIRLGIARTKAAFDAVDQKVLQAANDASKGRGYEWGAGMGSVSGGAYDGGGGKDPWDAFKDGAWALFTGVVLPHTPLGLLTNIKGDWLGYELDGDHPGVTGWIGKAESATGPAWDHREVKAYLGKGSAEIDADGYFMQKVTKREYENGQWTEKETFQVIGAEVAAGASVSFLELDYSSNVGDDMLGVETSAEGKVGSARAGAEGKFSIGEDGVNAYAKGEAIVAAVEGKASKSINFLGLEIKGEASGYAGGAGVEGEFGFRDGKFVMKGGVAAVIGGSVGIEIGLNDAGKEAVGKFVDFVTFWD